MAQFCRPSFPSLTLQPLWGAWLQARERPLRNNYKNKVFFNTLLQPHVLQMDTLPEHVHDSWGFNPYREVVSFFSFEQPITSLISLTTNAEWPHFPREKKRKRNKFSHTERMHARRWISFLELHRSCRLCSVVGLARRDRGTGCLKNASGQRVFHKRTWCQWSTVLDWCRAHGKVSSKLAVSFPGGEIAASINKDRNARLRVVPGFWK